MTNTVSTILAVLLAVAFIFFVYAGWLYYEENGHQAARRVEIKIAPGATLQEVQDLLVEEGLLERPNLFRWVAYISGKEKKIKSGRYIFRYGESVSSILGKLARGEIDYTRVVVPEGFMLHEIASLVAQKADVDSAAFHDLALDTAFVHELGFDAPSLEGYLFPDTYLFSWPLTEKDAILRMVHRFKEVYEGTVSLADSSLEFTTNELVTLASIIQAEAVWDSEMPHISAVYHNRLAQGMRLEADPTVAYSLGGVRRRLWYRDLRINSPYNTYRRKGLPPGPICSPGKTALLAAMQPLEECRDLYFVANGGGRHHFSETLAEHLEMQRRIRAAKIAPVEMEGKITREDSLKVLELPPLGGIPQQSVSSSGE
jgi:UPF0755 protein